MLISRAALLWYQKQATFNVPLVQSDSPKTAACEGLAVTVAVIKSVGFLLTEVRVSATHLVAICLPLDKRLPKLFAREKRKKKKNMWPWSADFPICHCQLCCRTALLKWSTYLWPLRVPPHYIYTVVFLYLEDTAAGYWARHILSTWALVNLLLSSVMWI